MRTSLKALAASALLLSGCGSSGPTGAELEDDIRPDIEADLAPRGSKLLELHCTATDSGGSCEAAISSPDGGEPKAFTLTATSGDNGTVWRFDQPTLAR